MRHIWKSSAAVVVLAVTALLGSAMPATAAIISTSAGVTVLAAPPPSVKLNQLEGNTDIFAFQEHQNYTLPVPLPVDITQPGTYDDVTDILLPSPIPAGTVVNAYFLHADPDLRLVTTGCVLYPS